MTAPSQVRVLLADDIPAYRLQLRMGFEADARSYDIAGAMLADLGVKSVRLMTNNPLKVNGVRAAGVVVSERVSHWVGENQHNAGYLAVKRRKMGHHPDTFAGLRALPAPKPAAHGSTMIVLSKGLGMMCGMRGSKPGIPICP